MRCRGIHQNVSKVKYPRMFGVYFESNFPTHAATERIFIEISSRSHHVSNANSIYDSSLRIPTIPRKTHEERVNEASRDRETSNPQACLDCPSLVDED